MVYSSPTALGEMDHSLAADLVFGQAKAFDESESSPCQLFDPFVADVVVPSMN
jgi:hypothetical protein